MKKLLFFCAALTATFTATGQHYYTDSANPDITRHSLRIAPQRVEFVLPEVGGYTVYKADLHTHSIYSDGDCTPEFRVREAWYDGLDVLAITEHVEYRRHEGKMLNFLKGYVPEGTEPVNYNIIAKPADEQGIRSDLNFPVSWRRRRPRSTASRSFRARKSPANQSPTVTTTRFSPPTTMRSTPPTPCNRCATPRRRERW